MTRILSFLAFAETLIFNYLKPDAQREQIPACVLPGNRNEKNWPFLVETKIGKLYKNVRYATQRRLQIKMRRMKESARKKCFFVLVCLLYAKSPSPIFLIFYFILLIIIFYFLFLNSSLCCCCLLLYNIILLFYYFFNNNFNLKIIKKYNKICEIGNYNESEEKKI